MKVVIFGLPYSPNVGDGVIADCLTHEILAQYPGAQVRVLDLSGRTAWGDTPVKNRRLALRILRALPTVLRQRLVLIRLGRLLDRVAPYWTRTLEGADLAIIGGGQLFSDADLNFPAKIACAAQTVAEAQVPLAIHSVGVARNWSARGTGLFARILGADLHRVAVRDQASQAAWVAQMGGGPIPALARDPGLLAASCYGAADPGEAVGVGVTAPEILSYHADAQVAGAQDSLGFWADLASAITSAGHPVRLFCNGAEEDRAALSRLTALPRIADLIAKGQISVAPPPRTSRALAREIRAMRAVVAHRLHACILAYAWQRPVIGLGWDGKVGAFFESVGMPDAFFDAENISGEAVAARLAKSLVSGIDPLRHAAVLAETRGAIAETLAHASGRNRVNR